MYCIFHIRSTNFVQWLKLDGMSIAFIFSFWEAVTKNWKKLNATIVEVKQSEYIIIY